ncbi:carboxypeptidase regulatory-like domain-containing protein [Amycolatopsis sp. WGS_07]|uniref:carboxypeptidase regulatory-like domain-containing protein n=1 Tax=Amycolatopsis sp. WGS_07 TaxID=3076764 RepID=UPI003872EF5E
MSRFLPLERSTLSSPAWFVPFDDYRRHVRTAGVSVLLDRWHEGVWVPQDTAAVRTPSAALAYPGLGRHSAGEPRRHRVRFVAAGYQPLYPADGQPFSSDVVGIEFVVRSEEDTAAPRLVRLLPAVTFPYPPGVRTVHGVVLDARTRAPLENVLVEARGRASRDPVSWHERTLSGARGAFRLALRWEGEKAEEHAVEETFRLEAVQRPGRTGALVVRLPRDAGTRQVIEIREQ